MFLAKRTAGATMERRLKERHSRGIHLMRREGAQRERERTRRCSNGEEAR